MKCKLHCSWKSQSLEMTHGNGLSLFLPVLTFYEIYYPTHLPTSTLLSAKKLKHYEHCMSHRLFSAHEALCLYPSQGPPEFITEDQSTRPFHLFMTFLIVLPTPSLHIEMVTNCTSYTSNRMCQIICKYTGIKICYKINKFAWEGNKSKVVRGTVLTLKKKWSLLQKSLRNAGTVYIYCFRAS